MLQQRGPIRRRASICAASGLGLLLLAAQPAYAGEIEQGDQATDAATVLPTGVAAASAVQPEPVVLSQAPDSGWQFSITPYLWFSGLKGEVGVFPQVPPVDVDLSFTDILSNFKIGGMVTLQAQKGRFVAIADITYVKIGTDKHVGIRDPQFAEIDLDTSSFSSTLVAGYRVADEPSAAFDAFAGIRISSSGTELTLTGPNTVLDGDASKTWVDPVVGARLLIPLGQSWNFTAYGDIGGFGVSSDMTWQLLGVVQYDLGGGWRVSAGWRHYVMDYEKSDFIYDVTMTGPILGVTYRF